MNGFKSVLFFFIIMCAIGTVFTVFWNYSELSKTGLTTSQKYDLSGVNLIDNSYLVMLLFNAFSENSMLFFMFLLPSVALYVFIYLLIKYFVIALVTSLIIFLVYLIAGMGLGIVQSMKISLYSMTIMILVDSLNVAWYNKFFVSLALFIILNALSSYFVTSDSV